MTGAEAVGVAASGDEAVGEPPPPQAATNRAAMARSGQANGRGIQRSVAAAGYEPVQAPTGTRRRSAGSVGVRVEAVGSSCRGAVRVAAKPWSADPRRMANRTRILMIGGAGRSGSTLCDMLLGAAPGAVAVGESVAIWGYGVVENGLCSCGAPFLDCPFWSAVGERAFGGWDAVVAQRYDGTEGEWPGVRRVLRKRILGPRSTPMRTEVAGVRARLYGAIAEVSGCEVIVDSSKHPYFSYQLSELEGFETRMVHLVRDPRATYRQSLRVLEMVKEIDPSRFTKSSLMMGLGEERGEVVQALRDLRSVACDVVTFGQYLQPSPRHLKVDSYVTPEAFAGWKTVAEDMGFLYVASGPLVRSSYRAGEFFMKGMIERRAKDAGALAAP